jgi:ubiquinone/menaquinone biosynthesis C-methylase UbiE
MEESQYGRMFQQEDWHWWFITRRQLAAVLLVAYVHPAPTWRILDVGCGTGGNLAWLKRQGSAVGLDLSPLALSLARRRKLSLAQASSLALPYPGQTFHLVTLFDILYHRWVTNDTQALTEAYRVLRPEGWLLVTDSALPALWSEHDEIFQARQRYTLPQMRTQIIKAGFTPVFNSYHNMFLLSPMAAMRWSAHWFPSVGYADLYPPAPWLNEILFRVRRLEISWLRRGHQLPVGSSLVCLAQKLEG